MIKSMTVEFIINGGALRDEMTPAVQILLKNDRRLKKAGTYDITNYQEKFAQINVTVY